MFFSHITRQVQYEHPCLVSCYNYQPEMRYLNQPQPPKPTHYQPHSVLVPANPYLLEEIPHWLDVYFRSINISRFVSHSYIENYC